MAVYHTVDGQPYSVTAGTDVQVSDADGLILGVSAGGQGSFVGNGGDVTITGDHHFVQIKGGGGGGGNGGGGGEPFDGNLPDNDLRVGELGGDKKIYLNGQEIMQESTVIVDVVEANNANAVTSNAVFNAIQAAAPHAPTPEPLEEDTAMRNGGVYTVAAAGAALNFSAVTMGDHATAEVWVECTAATNITWPPAWLWLEDSAPQVACDTATENSHRYRIVVRNEGAPLPIVARVAYDYSNLKPAQP